MLGGEPDVVEKDCSELCSVEGEVVRAGVPTKLDASCALSLPSVQRKGAHMPSVSARHSKAA